MFPAQADLAGLMCSLRCYYPFATLVPNHPTSLGKRDRQEDTPCTPAGEVPCTLFSSHFRWFCIRSFINSALMNDSTDSTRIMPQMLCYVNRSELSIHQCQDDGEASGLALLNAMGEKERCLAACTDAGHFNVCGYEACHEQLVAV